MVEHSYRLSLLYLQVYLGDNPSTSETRTLATAQKTRYVRIKITNDTNNLEKSELGLNFEFYGCTLTSDVSGERLHFSCVSFKVVICGKYKKLNKITKI